MKAFVDPDLCIGCTQCAGLCPEVFTMEGTLAVALLPADGERDTPFDPDRWAERSAAREGAALTDMQTGEPAGKRDWLNRVWWHAHHMDVSVEDAEPC